MGIFGQKVFWADNDCSATSVVELKGNCPPQRRNCSLSLATSVVELKGNCPPHFARREFQHPFGPPPTPSLSLTIFSRKWPFFALHFCAKMRRLGAFRRNFSISLAIFVVKLKGNWPLPSLWPCRCKCSLSLAKKSFFRHMSVQFPYQC